MVAAVLFSVDGSLTIIIRSRIEMGEDLKRSNNIKINEKEEEGEKKRRSNRIEMAHTV